MLNCPQAPLYLIIPESLILSELPFWHSIYASLAASTLSSVLSWLRPCLRCYLQLQVHKIHVRHDETNIVFIILQTLTKYFCIRAMRSLQICPVLKTTSHLSQNVHLKAVFHEVVTTLIPNYNPILVSIQLLIHILQEHLLINTSQTSAWDDEILTTKLPRFRLDLPSAHSCVGFWSQ